MFRWVLYKGGHTNLNTHQLTEVCPEIGYTRGGTAGGGGGGVGRRGSGGGEERWGGEEREYNHTYLYGISCGLTTSVSRGTPWSLECSLDAEAHQSFRLPEIGAMVTTTSDPPLCTCSCFCIVWPHPHYLKKELIIEYPSFSSAPTLLPPPLLFPYPPPSSPPFPLPSSLPSFSPTLLPPPLLFPYPPPSFSPTLLPPFPLPSSLLPSFSPTLLPPFPLPSSLLPSPFLLLPNQGTNNH